MANLENLKKLRDQLSRLPEEKFDMSDWIDHRSCGTVACIAGWASLLNGGPPQISAYGTNVKRFATNWLELEWGEAYSLFRGDWSPKRMEHITLPEAIAELDRLIAAEQATPAQDASHA